MPRRRTPPSQTWRTFLENHLDSTVAIDFFLVPTLTCRILFVLVVLAHDRRRILHVNVTQHPTSAWTRQQLREAFPNDANARFLPHDRDTTFYAAFNRAVEAFGLAAVHTAPCSPRQNPYVERVIGSIRRESVRTTLSSSMSGIFNAVLVVPRQDLAPVDVRRSVRAASFAASTSLGVWPPGAIEKRFWLLRRSHASSAMVASLNQENDCRCQNSSSSMR